ncbi:MULTISPECIES: gamma-glutamylcyclotransferase family protein [unclassified Okeania]|uniref:gamma-glutamylcyclotransferase family protein n=1 Tax=unclassified Okeania TaxID=2634635 RepID=UPI0013B9CA28|nr:MULTISPECIES: gamma-glutamylcyclotransferase family protein [unclassified Okeania]NES75432.1 gamma-glutamylcyclotransferase [Okeania sp. SIO1H4]NET12357.1 gamma-glutamylcyclotransferase [Okeania sp. SIO1H6]NET17854.1 gamma-glutamylcyclotransferase [Okeania sp. SIO1H5]NET92714.1 gamma-glutamylcyclotransferase [Okeania sp. SIO1H2]
MPSNAEQLFSSISNVKYFAYGSNLSKSLLEFKLASNLQTKDKYNTEPNSLILHSQPAILKNFEFKFNLYVPTNNVDPSYANLVYQKNSIVHGCLYEMSPECKAVIDGLEGKGQVYQEEIVQVLPYGSNTTINALTYIAYREKIQFPGLTIKEGIPPSKRYLNTLIYGAKECNLDSEWIEYLKNQKVATMPLIKLSNEELKKIKEKIYTPQDLKLKNLPLDQAFNEKGELIRHIISSICGLVFMCNPNQGFAIGARAWIKQILGRDMTVFYARRCLRNEGVSLYETEQDILLADRDCLDYVIANACNLLRQSRIEGEGVFLLGRTTNFHLWKDYL